jgi:hypothetical protein
MIVLDHTTIPALPHHSALLDLVVDVPADGDTVVIPMLCWHAATTPPTVSDLGRFAYVDYAPYDLHARAHIEQLPIAWQAGHAAHVILPPDPARTTARTPSSSPHNHSCTPASPTSPRSTSGCCEHTERESADTGGFAARTAHEPPEQDPEARTRQAAQAWESLLQIRRLVQPDHPDLPPPWEQAQPVRAVALALEAAGVPVCAVDGDLVVDAGAVVNPGSVSVPE